MSASIVPFSDRPLGPRIDEAIKRITSGHGAMRIPPDPTDPDLVLAACRERIAELEAEVLRLARLRADSTTSST